jgi:hypothetical protein
MKIAIALQRMIWEAAMCEENPRQFIEGKRSGSSDDSKTQNMNFVKHKSKSRKMDISIQQKAKSQKVKRPG